MLPVHEVARRLGFCDVTVYRLCARQDLAHSRVANRIRISEEDLGRFIESGNVKAGDRPQVAAPGGHDERESGQETRETSEAV